MPLRHHTYRLRFLQRFLSAKFVEADTQFLEEKRDFPERLRHYPPAFRGPWWWHGVAAVVCDGGSGAFGVEFDPATNTFSGLVYNPRR
jgi:hypothetical protein